MHCLNLFAVQLTPYRAVVERVSVEPQTLPRHLKPLIFELSTFVVEGSRKKKKKKNIKKNAWENKKKYACNHCTCLPGKEEIQSTQET
jgi:hypothetical protein